MKNKKTTFFIVLAVVLTAGIYYFYRQRNKSGMNNVPNVSDGKLYTFQWIGCNSCPSENVTPEMLSMQKSGFAGVQISANQGWSASKVSIGQQVQIVTNQGSDVEGVYEVIGTGAGCLQGQNGYENLLVLDLVWNCGSHPDPSVSNGGVLRIL